MARVIPVIHGQWADACRYLTRSCPDRFLGISDKPTRTSTTTGRTQDPSHRERRISQGHALPGGSTELRMLFDSESGDVYGVQWREWLGAVVLGIAALRLANEKRILPHHVWLRAAVSDVGRSQ